LIPDDLINSSDIVTGRMIMLKTLEIAAMAYMEVILWV
jgi:hypothetical protein